MLTEINVTCMVLISVVFIC